MKYLLILLTLSLTHPSYSQIKEQVLKKDRVLSIDIRLIEYTNVVKKTTSYCVVNTVTNDNYETITDRFVIMACDQKSVEKLRSELKLCLENMKDGYGQKFYVANKDYTLTVTSDKYYGGRLIVSSGRSDQFCLVSVENTEKWIDILNTMNLE